LAFYFKHLVTWPSFFGQHVPDFLLLYHINHRQEQETQKIWS
jgi:hypothetical protein